MEVKAAFTGHDRHNVLEDCEYGEDAALRAYHTALGSDDLPAYLKEMFTAQHELLMQSHNKVKALRDQHV
jgi:uncharacterized protein (TIGR02284 family)